MENSLNLLMLEDNPADVDLIQILLKRSGMSFNAVVASDEKEFHDALNMQSYDAVLADNALPQYSSIEALKIIREHNEHVAFILVTGTVSEEFAVRIIQQGADDYILKTNLARLPAAIVNAIAKKRNLQEKERLNAELRRITLHLENIREKEQQRIAREVHDQLGQIMTALKMDVAWLKKQNEKVQGDNRFGTRIDEISELLDEGVKTIRRIAADLRPTILDDLGLAEALEWQSIDFEKRSGINVSFQQEPASITVPPVIGTALFRIYREVLTNIARHAAASEINTRLELKDDIIMLTIRDNGKGFDTTTSFSSLGLLGMRERAYMVGGDLIIQSKPGAGTTVITTVPLNGTH